MSSKESLQDRYTTFIKNFEQDHSTTNQDTNSRVLVVDGLNTFIRSFSANPVVNDNGMHIGGMIGFLKSLRYTLAKIKPTRCIIVFDGKDGSKHRRKLFSEYKNHRKIKSRLNRNVDWTNAPVDEEQSMKMQLSRLIRYLENLPVTIICIDGVEADDVIAYISKQLLSKSKIIIMSTDKDFLHLINDRILVWSPTKKLLYNSDKIFSEFGIPSKNFLTYRILAGDKSDNIDGVRGAGLKTIKKYITPITEDSKFSIHELIQFIKTIDTKIKFIENVKNNTVLLKRNYLLMQLLKVDISGHIKLRIQEAIRKQIPQLIKYKFSTMFIQDKLWGQIPNMDSWITEFITLDRYRIRGN